MQIIVTDLRALDGNTLVAVYLLITSEEGQRDARIYHILPEQYASLRLGMGEITPEKADAIEEAAGLCGAIRKGMDLLSYGLQSERTLRQKLTRRGFSEEQAAKAAAYLKTQGLIDEGEDARRVTEGCRRKLWGPRRILTHLYEKRYPEGVIRQIQRELAEEEFIPDCITLIRKKYRALPEVREERQKMIGALLRYGYEMSHIRAAIAAMEAEDEA